MGSKIYTARKNRFAARGMRSNGSYCASFHDWLEEIQIFSQDGEYWFITLHNLRSAANCQNGIMIPIEQEVELLISDAVVWPEFEHSENGIDLVRILGRIGIEDRLQYSSAIDTAKFVPQPGRGTPSCGFDLFGTLKYNMFLPDDAVALLRMMSFPIPPSIKA